MRTLTPQEQAVLQGDAQGVAMRVLVKDWTGAFVDLTSLGEAKENYVNSANWGANIDDPVATAEVIVKREIFKGSIAPLVTFSPLNGGASGSLIAVGRELQIQTATLPLMPGLLPASGDWRLNFHGVIDSYDEADGGDDTVRLQCRDLGGVLQDRYIEAERAYCIWRGSRTMPTNMVIIRSSDTPGTTSAQYWKNLGGSGTTGSSEPSWPGSPTAGVTTQTDGGVTWTYQGNTPLGTDVEVVMQQILDDTLGAGVVSLAVPTTPNWKIFAYQQAQDNLLSALGKLAAQIGWDLRYVDSGASGARGSFALTLQAPGGASGRTSPSVAWTFTASDYRNITKASVEIAEERNRIVVRYPEITTLNPDGSPIMSTVQVDDLAAQTKYGVRWMGVAEGASSNINTSAQATQFANAMLADLKEPVLKQDMEIDFFWPVQLNDYFDYIANTFHYDGDQQLAVIAYKHELSNRGCRSIISCAGKPRSGLQRHLDNGVSPGSGRPQRTDPPPGTNANATSSGAIWGSVITYPPPVEPKWRYHHTVLHLSNTNGFTPDATTAKAVGSSGRFDLANLDPSLSWYYRLEHVDRDCNRVMSAQKTLAPQYVNLSHLNPSLLESFRAKITSTKSITIDSALTFDVEDYDLQGAWDGTNTWTVQNGGTYRVRALVTLSGTTAGQTYQLYMQKTHSGVTSLFTGGTPVQPVTDVAGNTYAYLEIDRVFDPTNLARGDTLEFLVACTTTTGTRTMQPVSLTSGPPKNLIPGSFVEVTQLLV